MARIALAATAAAAPLYVFRWHIGPLPTTLLETMIWITLALYVFTLWRRRGPLPGRTPFDIPIALFLVAGVIGVIVPPDHRGRGRLPAELLEVAPGVAPEQRGVEHDGVEPHPLELLDRKRARQQLRAPAHRSEPLCEHADEPAVGVDHGEPHCGRRRRRRVLVMERRSSALEWFQRDLSVEPPLRGAKDVTTPLQDFHMAATPP